MVGGLVLGLTAVGINALVETIPGDTTKKKIDYIKKNWGSSEDSEEKDDDEKNHNMNDNL